MADYTDVTAYVVLNDADADITTFPASFDGYRQAVMLVSVLVQAFPERTYVVGKEWVDGIVDDIITMTKANNRRG